MTMVFSEESERGLFTLLQSASPSAAYDAGERYPAPQCHPGTRAAVLHDLDSWAKGIHTTEYHSRIRWLYGPAGAGKSAIAQTFAQSCAARGSLIGSYFFWRSDPTRNNPQRLITTIALQMAIAVPELHAFINAAVLKDPMAVTSSIEKQVDVLIIQPWLKFRTNQEESTSQPKHPHVLIIDGLDECSDSRNQQHILSILPKITQTSGSFIQILVCSRPEPRIKEAFLGPTMSEVCHWMPLDDTFEASKDIEHFLEDGFAYILTRHSFSMQHIRRPWPTRQQIDYLVRKSSGQFIYASTVLKYVDEDGDVPAERLNIVLGLSVSEDVEGSLDVPFAELDALYHQILSTVKNRTLMLRVLAAWLAYYDGRITVGSFGDFVKLLDIPQGILHAIFSSLHSLFEGPSPIESGLSFCHASFQDFLFNRNRSRHFCISLATGHDYLAQCYLKIYGNPSYTVSPIFSLWWDFFHHSVRASGTASFISELDSFQLYDAVSLEVGRQQDMWEWRLAFRLADIFGLWTKFQHCTDHGKSLRNFQGISTAGFILVVSENFRFFSDPGLKTEIAIRYSSSSRFVGEAHNDCGAAVFDCIKTELRNRFHNTWESVRFEEIRPLWGQGDTQC
ncbi:hypothetical protein D9757_011766 [Collybiopsis confluens]|uniref:Nephrocystin 3-like N-terminal domain-containing protein n=1 Tax=Collybiopsis confluens TaxID=2823264 RepID=A0A8H5LPU3_9AGAR|nr:hypothetical protein D9757_011766 [Collybiopsis confluens]